MAFATSRSFRLVILCLLALGASLPARAQQTGDCAPGRAERDLNVNDVLARVFNGGNLFYGNTTVAGDGYLVPKAFGHSPIFAAELWVGGLVEGELRTAGATYNDFEFWPGPLALDGAGLPAGVYFVRLETGRQTESITLVHVE